MAVRRADGTTKHAPDLFSYIQGIVDERDQPGQLVLTGSQNFLIHRQISQSLAGRCDILHLLPFSRSRSKVSAMDSS